jgi:hypothetical protein
MTTNHKLGPGNHQAGVKCALKCGEALWASVRHATGHGGGLCQAFRVAGFTSRGGALRAAHPGPAPSTDSTSWSQA